MKHHKLFLILLIAFFTIFTFHNSIVGTSIYGDGIYYYTIARSIAIDRDLKFENEYSFFNIQQSKTNTGYFANKYPPGVSLFWSIPLYILHVVFGGNGYSTFYQHAIGFITILFSFLGLYYLKKLLENYFSSNASLYSLLGLILTTNLLFYISVDVINSHLYSFSLSCIYFYLLLQKKQKTNKIWFFIGLISGLLGLARTQDLLFFIVSILILFFEKNGNSKKIIFLSLLLLGLIIGFLPQIIFWKIIYGTLLISPYLNEGFNFLKPQILGVLFNKDTGLFLWTPAYLFAVIGLFYLKSKNTIIKRVAFFTFISQFYLVSSWSSWNQGGSFGVRMLISSLPILSFGYARLFEIIIKKTSNKLPYILIGIFTVLNSGLIVLYLVTH